ncbi:MAG: 16S rRNA (cytidine(1402)-2'-O)-methyltransferase [Candidatus Hydrogenedentota bacterium]
MSGRLYVIGTPVGNLEDITLRALKTLREVDIIYAETPDKIKKILYKYEIKNKLIHRLREFEAFKKSETIIQELKNDKNVAVVSDSGTPGIQDPGNIVVDKVLLENLKVVPIPGASALNIAVSICGFRCDRFIFEGFLPVRVSKKRKRLQELYDLNLPVVIFESPYKIKKTLEIIKEIFKNRKICIAREMTKIYEEIYRGNCEDLLNKIYSNEIPLKGEFTLIINKEYD